VVVRIARKGSEKILHRRTYRKCKHSESNKAWRKHKQSQGNSYSLKRSKWWAAILVNTEVS